MKKLYLILLTLFIFFVSTNDTKAIYDPTSVPNNPVGIHLFSEKDLDDAKNLVNTNGGDWGYVTIVITEAERDRDRWQKVFDQMRKYHLIPIIRIATKGEGENWIKPQDSEITNWVSFLNSLNWVIQNRYIIVANEPNHATEWGGELKPDEYASYLKKFSQALKSVSNDFFVLPAALDASANGKNDTMEQTKFIKEMVKKEPDLFDHLDGWNSHSYPNPDFSGKETEKGQKTIAGFEWEINYLQSLGINKKLPVFITETGWSNENIDNEKIADKFDYAYKNVWDKKEIVAVTPFILNYPEKPFDKFTWKTKEGEFTPVYKTVKNMTKQKGEPIQIVKGDLIAELAPPIIFSGSEFAGALLAKNTGQTIWNSNEIRLVSDSEDFAVSQYSFNEIEPMRMGLIFFRTKTPPETGQNNMSLYLEGVKKEKVSNTFQLKILILKLENSKILGPIEKLISLVSDALFKR